MTERELFKDFYRLMRMREGMVYGTCDLADVHEVNAIANAALAGMSITKIIVIQAKADKAIKLSKQPHNEPSQWSAGIQMLVHTHGRVRRSA